MGYLEVGMVEYSPLPWNDAVGVACDVLRSAPGSDHKTKTERN
jgi:hypothetical protein